MKRTFLLLAVMAISAGTFGVAVHAWRGAQVAEAERTELRRKFSAAERALQAAETRRAAAERARKEAEVGLAEAKTAAATAASPKKTQLVVLISERLERDPEVQAATRRMDRAQVGVRYGAYFRRAGLAPTQEAQFTENVLRKQERISDLQAVVEKNRLTWSDPAVQAEEKQAEDDYQTAQRALLGDAGYRTLYDYERTISIRDYMADWAGGAVVMAGQPFTPEQGERLVQAMANASESYQRGGDAFFGDGEFWERVDAEAKKILTPAQFEFFTQAEPPLPRGGRYQVSFHHRVEEAVIQDKDERSAAK